MAKRIENNVSALQAELVRQIATLAVEQRWTAGTPLPEQTLANQFGVSRSPMHGALSYLVKEGFAKVIPGKGFVLSRPIDTSSLDTVLPASTNENLYTSILTDRALRKIPAEVSEAALAERYETSRGTVRKVLMRLATDGLAQRQRGHGWQFSEALDTPQAVAESYEFRISIECGSLLSPRFAADRRQLDDLTSMQRELMKGVGNITRMRWFRANALFHETLIAWSHNRFFSTAIKQQNSLRQMQEFASFETISRSRILQSCEEHLAILEAVAAEDLALAEVLMRRHLLIAAKLPDVKRDPPARNNASRQEGRRARQDA